MSSGSVIGRCRMTAPAAEKMTTKIIRTTPVFMELSVCQVLRDAVRSDWAIAFLVLAREECTFHANFWESANHFTFNVLQHVNSFLLLSQLSHNTHLRRRALRFHPLLQASDSNHKAQGACVISTSASVGESPTWPLRPFVENRNKSPQGRKLVLL